MLCSLDGKKAEVKQVQSGHVHVYLVFLLHDVHGSDCIAFGFLLFGFFFLFLWPWQFDIHTRAYGTEIIQLFITTAVHVFCPCMFCSLPMRQPQPLSTYIKMRYIVLENFTLSGGWVSSGLLRMRKEGESACKRAHNGSTARFACVQANVGDILQAYDPWALQTNQAVRNVRILLTQV